MPNPLKSAVHQLGRRYIDRICAGEASSQTFSHRNERPIEYSFALRALLEHRATTVLDVGTGTTAWPHLVRNCGFAVTAIDNVRDYWPAGMINRHWQVKDVDITNPGEFKGPFSAITCISVLEHIADHLNAMEHMFSLLDKGGVLILTCPYRHTEYSPNVYKRPDALYGQDAPYICQSYSQEELNRWLAMGANLKSRELWRLFTGDVWATGERVAAERIESEDQLHQLGCFVLQKSL